VVGVGEQKRLRDGALRLARFAQQAGEALALFVAFRGDIEKIGERAGGFLEFLALFMEIGGQPQRVRGFGAASERGESARHFAVGERLAGREFAPLAAGFDRGFPVAGFIRQAEGVVEALGGGGIMGAGAELGQAQGGSDRMGPQRGHFLDFFQRGDAIAHFLILRGEAVPDLEGLFLALRLFEQQAERFQPSVWPGVNSTISWWHWIASSSAETWVKIAARRRQ
jgi:hypothetical protein